MKMKFFKKIFALLALLLICSACAKTSSPTNTNVGSYLTIKNKILQIEIADSPEERELGLSYRKFLPENSGMLFIFETEKIPSFWMKDMEFNLDMIWLNKNKIIGITPDVQAPIRNLKSDIKNLPNYSPPSSVDMVLEVNAGWAKKNNITVGDDVIFEK